MASLGFMVSLHNTNLMRQIYVSSHMTISSIDVDVVFYNVF